MAISQDPVRVSYFNIKPSKVSYVCCKRGCYIAIGMNVPAQEGAPSYITYILHEILRSRNTTELCIPHSIRYSLLLATRLCCTQAVYVNTANSMIRRLALLELGGDAYGLEITDKHYLRALILIIIVQF